MNWFKKIATKFFNDIDEKSNDEEEQFIQPTQHMEFNQKKQPKFQFPIIGDDEIEKQTAQTRTEDKSGMFSIYNEQKSHQGEMHSKVYDVEVPKIRELLEQRRTTRRYSPMETPNFLINRKKMEYKNNRKTIEKTNQNTNSFKKINPLDNRRRFIPTEVPSPVYGLKKPSSINTLLRNKEEKEHDDHNEMENSQIHNQVVENEIASAVEHSVAEDNVSCHEIKQEQKQEQKYAQEPEQKQEREYAHEQGNIHKHTTEYQHLECSESILNEFQESNEEVKNDNQYEEVKNDNQYEEVKNNNQSTIELEKIENSQIVETSDYESEEVEEIPTVTPSHNQNDASTQLVQENEGLPEHFEAESSLEERNQDMNEHQEEQIEKDTEERKSKNSTIPFNVIMLKSDKKNLKTKRNIQLTQPKTSAEHHPAVPNDSKEIIKEDSKDCNENMDDVENREINEHSIKKSSEDVYIKPSIDFLMPPEETLEDREWMDSQAKKLVEALSYFHVKAQVVSVMQGPAVTQFEITVAHGIKVSKIRNLSDDLKLALAAKDIRIQAPIPGKSSIGIEIPNRISRAVRLSEVVSSEIFQNSESPMEAVLGLDLTGKPMTTDLRKMPHGLIAGATGSGKSVCINSILVSLLFKARPDELKLMLIDPKMVELAPFNKIPHLVCPVITDVKAATEALKWAVEEMERRYQLFAHAGVRDLPRFNKMAEKAGQYHDKLPYILIVIDELADLMMMSPADVEEAICRIAQKARACGIHLIVATQRPSVDVITGLIKSNIPTRIAFAVSSQVDSRTIIDQQGAERLLGRGDMLYLGNGMSAPIRLQGTFVTDDEIDAIVDHVKQQGEPNYFFEQEELLKKSEMIDEQDELFEEVCYFVMEQGAASTSLIQRRFHIGYNRAARLIDMLEQHGFVSEQRGSKPREVYITQSDLTSLFRS